MRASVKYSRNFRRFTYIERAHHNFERERRNSECLENAYVGFCRVRDRRRVIDV